MLVFLRVIVKFRVGNLQPRCRGRGPWHPRNKRPETLPVQPPQNPGTLHQHVLYIIDPPALQLVILTTDHLACLEKVLRHEAPTFRSDPGTFKRTPSRESTLVGADRAAGTRTHTESAASTGRGLPIQGHTRQAREHSGWTGRGARTEGSQGRSAGAACGTVLPRRQGDRKRGTH